jgi:hypothetical protein
MSDSLNFECYKFSVLCGGKQFLETKESIIRNNDLIQIAMG